MDSPFKKYCVPFFCPLEVNFKSDSAPGDLGLDTIEDPSEFFVDSEALPIRRARVAHRLAA